MKNAYSDAKLNGFLGFFSCEMGLCSCGNERSDGWYVFNSHSCINLFIKFLINLK